jgi:paraquat-inducible protein B
MSVPARALRIGTFVLAGVGLLVGAALWLGGGRWLTRSDQVVMHFRGSTYGLQIGAPVVFRGVSIGTVQAIGLRYDAAHGDYAIPVRAELEHARLLDLVGPVGASAPRGAPVAVLVERGLRAQLATQSLLTGQLYVDLDLRPKRESLTLGGLDGAPEIPTTPTPIQALKDQLEGLDVRALIDNLSAIASSARAVVGDEQLKRTMLNLAEASERLNAVSVRLDQRFDGLADGTTRSLRQVQRAADRVGVAADRITVASGRVDALLQPDAPLVRSAQASLDELRRTLSAVRGQASGDSDLMRHADQALQDLSRASQAVEDLADLLERQPQALIRGRQPPGERP